MTADYRCLKCNHQWTQARPKCDACPRCGNFYFVWTNYEAGQAAASPEYRALTTGIHHG